MSATGDKGFDEVAQPIADNNYRPVPIKPGDKAPAVKDWPHFSLQAEDKQRFAGYSTGILTGHGYIAVDKDVREPDAAAKIERLIEATLGPAPIRIGQEPKSARLYRFTGSLKYLATRRFRMPGDKPGDKAHRVEVLGLGKQLVCYGPHPDTHKLYTWNGAGEPLTTKVAELREVTEKQLREVIADIDGVLADYGTPIVGRSTLATDTTTHEASKLGKRALNPQEFRKALAWLPNDYDRETWIRLAHSIKAALGPEGWPDFEAWCQKSPSYTGSDTRRVWDSLDPTKSTAGMLLHEARARGWKHLLDISLPTLHTINTSQIPPKVPIVAGLLYPGAFVVTGRPKIGKSWLLLQLALAIAEGGTFLGYQCAQHDVLAVFSEDDDARIKERLGLLGVANAPANVHVINQSKLRDLAKKFAETYSFIEFLQVWLHDHPKVQAVIIDTETTVRQVWTGECGSGVARVTETDYKQTRVFDELALSRKVLILLSNHASKRKGGEWFDIHELINRSNTALAGTSGSIALADPPDADPLDPTQKTRVLGVRGRDLADDVMLAVHQEKAPPVFISDGPYVEVRQTQAENQVLSALEELMLDAGDAYVSSEDISLAVGTSRNAVKLAMSRMKRKGRTIWGRYRVLHKAGKHGGYRLVPLSDAARE